MIGVDYGLVVPDETKSLRDSAIRPWRSESYSGWNDDLVEYAKKRGVPVDIPWRELTEAQRQWVLEGDPGWVSWRKSWPGKWYGVGRFFKWLESKAYKMHVRVLLSRYRAYTPCTACGGARLKTEALGWRLGTAADADAVLKAGERFLPNGVTFGADVLARLPGLAVHDLMLLPIEQTQAFFSALHLPSPLDEATDLLLPISRPAVVPVTGGARLSHARRQSRTLSGGEVQRINLTTASERRSPTRCSCSTSPRSACTRVIWARDRRHEEAARRRQFPGGGRARTQIMSPPTAYSTSGPGRASAAARWCSSVPRSAKRSGHAHRDYLSGRRNAARYRVRPFDFTKAPRIEIRGPRSTTSRTSM